MAFANKISNLHDIVSQICRKLLHANDVHCNRLQQMKQTIFAMILLVLVQRTEHGKTLQLNVGYWTGLPAKWWNGNAYHGFVAGKHFQQIIFFSISRHCVCLSIGNADSQIYYIWNAFHHSEMARVTQRRQNFVELDNNGIISSSEWHIFNR